MLSDQDNQPLRKPRPSRSFASPHYPLFAYMDRRASPHLIHDALSKTEDPAKRGGQPVDVHAARSAPLRRSLLHVGPPLSALDQLDKGSCSPAASPSAGDRSHGPAQLATLAAEGDAAGEHDPLSS